ncbi:NAD(P)H-dependent oxidoreductase (plasmid) [Cupriavidus necator]|uniref:NAD(P)H-dependent oxidoreductase n=1 Tax=Cupriavidus necator TaxID=106590 RepID=A0A367PMC2_CUPNE|nr:NADPH-dependent FMN reductase [Cupriavidus necator]QQX89648.1 NAD(P)H-dependent oxidoreductase [Cupriavidus necator]RCJ09020.1 NAD(P)H-dependent oxidoreductase [Cupriavidus necator]
MPDLKLLGISGSMRRDSNNTAVLRTLQVSMPAGIGLSVITLDDIPLYNQDVELCGVPPGVQEFKSAIEASDGIILCSPEYNCGMPGVLKNALDWVSRPALTSPMKGKPVLIVTSSPAFTGGVRAQAQLRDTLSGMLARVIAWPQVVIAGVHGKVQAGGLVDEASVKFLLDAVGGLAAEIALLPSSPSAAPQT